MQLELIALHVYKDQIKIINNQDVFLLSDN